jgi:hypothetical protein
MECFCSPTERLYNYIETMLLGKANRKKYTRMNTNITKSDTVLSHVARGKNWWYLFKKIEVWSR